MASYNLTRYVHELLAKTDSSPPSFTVHLHTEYWTLNNGSKFLYTQQPATLLDDIRAQRIPPDFIELFDSSRVLFYDGCLIVELLDYRPRSRHEKKADDKKVGGKAEGPERSRVVLHPTPESLWADVCLLNQKTGNKWTDQDALEVEARVLLSTAPPICLDPDPHLLRAVNSIVKVSTPTIPPSLKRKASALEPGEDKLEKARRAKLVSFMNPRLNNPPTPNFAFLDALHRNRPNNATEGRQSAPVPGPSNPPTAEAVSRPSIPRPGPQDPAPTIAPPQIAPSKSKQGQTSQKGKAASVRSGSAASDRITIGTPTPVISNVPLPPHLPNSRQSNQPSPAPPPRSPMPNPVYAAVQQSADPGKRNPSPAQHHSPRPSSSQPQHPQPQPQPHPARPVQYPQYSSPTPFQPSLPNAQFLQQPPAPKNSKMQNKPANGSTPTLLTQPLPQQQPQPTAGPSQPQQNLQQAQTQQYQRMYAHVTQYQQYAQQQHNQQQQRVAQAQVVPNGRSTPQVPIARSPMVATQDGQVVRGSPMPANQQQATRSPMPTNTAAQPQSQPHPAQQHNIPYPYNAAQLHPLVAGHPHPAIPHHMVNGVSQPTASPGPQGQPTQEQQQQHLAQAYPMMHYGQMYFGPQRMAPPYWGVPMGRGMPSVINGQHQMPGMAPNAGHPQQIVGKPVQGGLQGR